MSDRLAQRRRTALESLDGERLDEHGLPDPHKRAIYVYLVIERSRVVSGEDRRPSGKGPSR
jgi:hypothetical protein